MQNVVVIDTKFVLFMFLSLAINYIKITETGELRMPKIVWNKKFNFLSFFAAIQDNYQTTKSSKQNSSLADNYHSSHEEVSIINSLTKKSDEFHSICRITTLKSARETTQIAVISNFHA
jgi:cytoskeletal protein RodZ